MIPKIIHQIWIGGKQISKRNSGFTSEWRSMYSDYIYSWWDDAKVEAECIIPEDKKELYYSKDFPFAFKADILRYELIRKFGGIYIDVDTEPLRKMGDEVLEGNFFAGFQNNIEIAIGIFGAIPNCPLIVDVCDNLVPNVKEKLSQGCKEFVDQLTGPIFFTKICKKYFGLTGFKFFPPRYFYPYWFTESHRANEDFKATCPEAYSVHHWTKSWL